jgi:hypothetical protein
MDHSIPDETTGALAQERYGIASPAPRHGFIPPVTDSPFNLMGWKKLSTLPAPSLEPKSRCGAREQQRKEAAT